MSRVMLLGSLINKENGVGFNPLCYWSYFLDFWVQTEIHKYR